MYELAAFLEPPKDGLAAPLAMLGDCHGPWLWDFSVEFLRPFVFHRWWYRQQA